MKVMQRHIVIFDSGKEWGGGTNSLLQLVQYADTTKFYFHVVFLFNYANENSTIGEAIRNDNVNFHLINTQKNKYVKLIKELARVVFFFNKNILKEIIFLVDYIFTKKHTITALKQIINENNIDLIYGNNQISSNLEAIIAAKSCNKKYIQHLRITAPIRRLEKYLIGDSISLMIANSRGTYKYFKDKVINSKITILPNAIDTSTVHRSYNLTKEDINIAKDIPVITMIGSLIPRKRYDIFIQSLSIIKGDFIALIVGKGPELQRLKLLVKSLHLDNKVRFLGFRSDVLDILTLSDIFVLSSNKEPFGRVFLEAMLCKIPIISSNNMECDQVVIDGYNGYLAKYEDPQDFAKKINILIKDKDIAIQFGKNGYKLLLEKFDVNDYINKLSSILIDP
jgi:glycosyltransferase involved in cell wall biosynthesis